MFSGTAFWVRQSSVSAYALPPPFKKEAFGRGELWRFFVLGRRMGAHRPNGSFGKGAEPRRTPPARLAVTSLCTARWTKPLSRRRRGLTARLPRRKFLAWAMQRGGSPVNKGAPRSRSCGDTARPLRTLGPGSGASRWLRIVSAAAVNPFGSAFLWRPIPSPLPDAGRGRYRKGAALLHRLWEAHIPKSSLSEGAAAVDG